MEDEQLGKPHSPSIARSTVQRGTERKHYIACGKMISTGGERKGNP